MKNIISVSDITVRLDMRCPKRFVIEVMKQIDNIRSRGNSAEIKYSTSCDGDDFCQSALILEIKGE